MAKHDRTPARLTDKEVTSFVNRDSTGKTRVLHDGAGVNLVVDKRGASIRWEYKFSLAGKRRTAGLGRYPNVSLAEARRKAAAMRKLVKDKGQDPVAAKRAEKAARAVTFRDVAAAYMKSHHDGWTPKYGRDVRVSLETWAFPIIGDMAIANVDRDAVERVLGQDVNGRSFWTAHTVTATRVRARLESVLGYAAAKEQRAADNPARWDVVKHLFPAKGKVHAIKEHPQVPWKQMPAFMAFLRAQEGVVHRALEWTVLTNPRSGSTGAARWSQIDLEHKVWTIPSVKSKGKTKQPHRIPLSTRAIAILEAMPSNHNPDDLVFQVGDKPLASNGDDLLEALRRIVVGNKQWHAPDGRLPDVHGFRTSFRTWCQDATEYSRDLVELCMAHKERSATVAAYARGDMLELRRPVMQGWADYCSG